MTRFAESISMDEEALRLLRENNCKKGKEAGICSEERSMISSDYARNFICDFILGKQTEFTQKTLF